MSASAFADAITDITTIDDDIRTAIDELAKHERCLRRCQSWRDWATELDELFDLRLKFMDRRDLALAELAPTEQRKGLRPALGI